MINKTFSEIGEADLLQLVTDGITESKTIEYKLNFNDLNQPKTKKEFLADISALANCLGGDLLIGVAEEEGKAVDVPGIEIADQDALVLQIEQILQSGLVPRIAGLQIRSISLANSRYVMAIRVPKSWLAPHIVWFEQTSKFYSRHHAGNYQLDHEEIKMAFLSGAAPQEKLREFRKTRLDYLKKEYALKWPERCIGIVLQILPLSAFLSAPQVDMKRAILNPNLINPFGRGGYNSRFNYDGYLTYKGNTEDVSSAYLQIYRDGCVEYFTLMSTTDVPLGYIEKMFAENIKQTKDLLFALGVFPPAYVCISILNTADKVAATNNAYQAYKCKEWLLALPEIGLESLEAFSMNTLRPAFDVLSNAFGYPRSRGYDDQGIYKP